MIILFLGDIVGKGGVDAIENQLPFIIKQKKIDFVIVNAENSSDGFGTTKSIMKKLLNAGVDAITMGNHTFDNHEIYNWIDDENRIIRPHNISKNAPGKGANVIKSKTGHLVLVSQVLGRIFMKPEFENPWSSIDNIIPKTGNPINNGLDAIVIDIHAETTSEKQGIGCYVDGKVSLAIGTHTHVPTADTRILSNGTAYQTDAGMCGCYNSIIGMEIENSINRMMNVIPTKRFVPIKENITLSGIIVETEPTTGLARTVKPVRIGGYLQQTN